MENPSEGKVLDIRDEEPFEYYAKRLVPGIKDVEEGLRVNVPTTIYNLTADDASGVAGILMPSGEFIQSASPRVSLPERFWEFDETLGYERVKGEDGKDRVRGNSWTTGTVVWDGVVNGSVDLASLDGDDEEPIRLVVKRRTHEASLTGDWQSTGELWRAIRRGTRQAGTEMGAMHLNNGSHVENAWDSFGDSTERRAA